MTAQQLKNSILQMAVQGKLVPQDPNDEPASVLLERIKAEKQELIKAGKIKKDKKPSEIFRGASRNLPYAFCEQVGKEIRDISEEVTFEIPDSWEWCRLSFANDMYTGNSINESEKKAKYTNLSEGRYYIGTKDVEFNHYIIYENGVKIPFEAEKFRIAPCNSILMCIEGGSAGKKIAFTKYDVCFGNKLCCFVAYGVDYKFLYYYLQSPVFQSAFKENTTGIIGGVSVNTLKSMLFPIPPIEEQKRIVDKLSDIIPFIEKYAQVETQLAALNTSFPETLKKSILQEAVQGRLVPQDPNDEPASVLLERIRAEKQALVKAGKIKKDKHESVIVTRDKIPYEIIDGKEHCIAEEVPFEIPEGWCWCRLIDIIKYKPTNGLSPKGVDYKTDVRNLTLTATTSGRFKSDAFKYVDISHADAEKYWLENGDILIQRSNSRELVGTSCIYYGNEMSYIYPDLMMRIHTSNEINVKYIDYVLKSPFIRKYYSRNASGTSTSMPKINQQMVSLTLIPLPPQSEQERIVIRIDELLKFCEKL